MERPQSPPDLWADELAVGAFWLGVLALLASYWSVSIAWACGPLALVAGGLAHWRAPRNNRRSRMYALGAMVAGGTAMLMAIAVLRLGLAEPLVKLLRPLLHKLKRSR